MAVNYICRVRGLSLTSIGYLNRQGSDPDGTGNPASMRISTTLKSGAPPDSYRRYLLPPKESALSMKYPEFTD